MTTFDRINRRAHLYLGLVLIPWVVMFGVSSFVISHHATWFKSDQQPAWEPVFERSYQHPVPDDANDLDETHRQRLRVVAAEILRENDLEGAFYAERPSAGEVRINRNTFLDQTRLTYSIKEQKLRAERQRRTWDQVVMAMHTRDGHEQPLFLNKLWAIIVDITCLTILLWIVSGIIMWWRLAKVRIWGAIALGGGIASFLLLVWRL